jgi:hypothetical protein
MHRFLVISGHTAEDCRQAVKYFAEFHAGYITHFEWGCKDNDHNAYAILEAENHEEAMMSVPPLFRRMARVIRLTYFRPDEKGDDEIHKTD